MTGRSRVTDALEDSSEDCLAMAAMDMVTVDIDMDMVDMGMAATDMDMVELGMAATDMDMVDMDIMGMAATDMALMAGGMTVTTDAMVKNTNIVDMVVVFMEDVDILITDSSFLWHHPVHIGAMTACYDTPYSDV